MRSRFRHISSQKIAHQYSTRGSRRGEEKHQELARHFEKVAEVSWLLRHRVRAVAFDVHGFLMVGVLTEKAPVVKSCVSALVTAILRADGSGWIMHTCPQARIRRRERLGRERESLPRSPLSSGYHGQRCDHTLK
jgi:hypothetical protein